MTNGLNQTVHGGGVYTKSQNVANFTEGCWLVTTQELRRDEAEELNLRVPHSRFNKAGLELATPQQYTATPVPPHHRQPCVNNPCISCLQGCCLGGSLVELTSSSEVSSSNLSQASE